MFKNLLRSMTTIALLAVVVLIQIIIVFQNNNIESQNIAAKSWLKMLPPLFKLWLQVVIPILKVCMHLTPLHLTIQAIS